MARSLLIAGLIVLALGILFQVAALLITVAIPIGIGLAIVGGIWLLVERAARS
ncbi:MAG: hypothetical protein ACE149_05915 [Armatimonadota bacterium]